MRIALLSRNPRSYSTRRLRSVAIRRGHVVRVLDTLQFSLFLEGGGPSLLYRGRKPPPVDAVVPRIGTSTTLFGTAVVRQYEQLGVFCLNGSHAITVARDKLRAFQALARHALGMPTTAFVHERADVLSAIDRVGGAPVILKLLEGSQGLGVILAETKADADAIIEMLQEARQQVLIQKFVAESKGRDVRALVVGGHVVAAMRRRAQAGEFRANIHRGGQGEALELAPEYETTAVRAAQVIGLEVAGVDMLESAEGPQVLEVNSSPGLEGIEAATGVDVAAAVISHLEEQAQFPEVDLKERLQIGPDWQIAELTVHDMPRLQNASLAEADLGLGEVRVLSIRRAGLLIGNPRGSTTILPGDTLLLHGRRLALQALMREAAGAADDASPD